MMLRPGTEIETIEGVETAIGRDLRQMTPVGLHDAGHGRVPILKAIRAHCIECSGGSTAEVRRCTAVNCDLWPFRMGTNPFREAREMSEEQRAAAADRLRKAREAKAS